MNTAPSDVHDQIEDWLAAAVHGELSSEEQNRFDEHIAGCPACRRAFEEQNTMNNLIADSMAAIRPDDRFEQRLMASFNQRVPHRTGVVSFLSGLMQMRATQIAGVAALLLTLTQVGRWLTDDPFGNEELAVQAAPASGSLRELRSRLGAGEVARAQGKSSTEVLRHPARASAGMPAPSAPATGSSGPSPVLTLNRDLINAAPPQAAPPPPPSGGRAYAATKEKKSDRTNDVAEASSESAPHEAERTIVTGSNIPTAEENGSSQQQPGPDANRKLIRNASVELEVASFDKSAQQITAFAGEDGGYVATTSSEKQENGKLRGEIVVKVLPQHLDRFLGKLRGLGELKNQTLGTEDVTKQYFDTDSRLKNGRAMEQRLLEILKKKSEDINDLLQVEKELGRVRSEIDQMQGELKFIDAQVQFATVTITLAEKDMNVPAAFLLKERAQLALYSSEVEKIHADIKALASPKVQITNAQLDRDNTGRVSARISILIAPEESDAVIARVKAMARVANFQVQTERVSRGGSEGMSESAKTERDKVELNVTISKDEQEQPLQNTSLRIQTSDVSERAKQLRDLAEKHGGRVRSSSFSRDPNGREYASVSLRVAMKENAAMMQSLSSLGKLEDLSVHREDRPGAELDEATAPADISIQIYSQGNVLSEENGLLATLRRTVSQGVAALMWSVRMIGVALAFFLPWVAALAIVVWLVRRVRRSRELRRERVSIDAG